MKHGWEYKKLKNVCDKGASNIQQNKIAGVDGDYAVYGASGYVQNIDFYHQEKPYIGIVKDGSGVGRVNVYPAKTSLLGTMQYILPKQGVSLGYIAYVLKGLNLAKLASGAAIPHIYFRDYGESFIPVPPIKEQEEICSLLDKLSFVIEKKKEQVKELDNLAQAIFYEMFGDPLKNEKGWEAKKLGNVCEVTSSKRVYQSEWKTSGIPFYRISDFVRLLKNERFESDLYISIEKYEELRQNNLVPNSGDILITSRGTLGDCYIVKENDRFYFQDGMITWLRKMSKNIHPLFVVFLFKNNSFRQQIDKNQSGSTVAYLSISMLKKFIMAIPPLSLQQSFAKKVESIERQKELINKSIREAQTLFDSRMEYYFGE